MKRLTLLISSIGLLLQAGAQSPDLSLLAITVTKNKMSGATPPFTFVNIFTLDAKNTGLASVLPTDTVYFYWKKQSENYTEQRKRALSGTTHSAGATKHFSLAFTFSSPDESPLTSPYCIKLSVSHNGVVRDLNFTNNERCEIASTGFAELPALPRLLAFPNPAGKLIHFADLKDPEGTIITLNDLLGRTAAVYSLNKNETSITVEGITPGNYILTASKGSRVRRTKVTIGQ